MMLLKNLNPILSIVFGFLILVNPKLLGVLVGIYLIATGLIALGLLRL